MARPSSDVAFTPAVKAAQTQRGSRASYARVERSGGFATEVDDDLAAFLAERDSFYLATASAEGQPYVQHRGGPKGFVHVLDAHTLAFADFAGNRQFVSLGNLSENPRAFLFFMDHARRQRIKVWGKARVVEDDPTLLAQLTPAGYAARPERVIVFTVEAWDANCPQHIPQLLPAKEVQAALDRKDARIRELEAALARQGA